MQFLRKMQKQSKNWPGVQYPLNVKMIFLVKREKKKRKKKGGREEEYKKKECNLILEEMQIVTQPSGKTKLSFVLQNLPAVLFTEMKFHVRTYLPTLCSNKYGLASGSIWIPIQNKKLIFCDRLILQKGYKVNLKAMYLCRRKLINSWVNHTIQIHANTFENNISII